MSTGRRADVFVDLCTQRDYLAPNGARPVLNLHRAIPNIKHVVAFARWSGGPLLSCVDVRRPADVRGLPHPDCVLGTAGQSKLACTLLPARITVDSDNCLCVSLDLFQHYQQAILSKEHRDPFTNPKLDRLLTELPARRFVVFGVALETTVRLLALGLLLRHRRVAVVYDACGWWNQEDGEMALRQLSAKGCELLSAQQVVESAVRAGRSPLRTRRRSVA